jgi:hypothetical protein
MEQELDLNEAAARVDELIEEIGNANVEADWDKMIPRIEETLSLTLQRFVETPVTDGIRREQARQVLIAGLSALRSVELMSLETKGETNV